MDVGTGLGGACREGRVWGLGRVVGLGGRVGGELGRC